MSTRGGVIRSFTPQKTVAFESLVAMKAEAAMAGAALFDGPVSLTLMVVLPVAESWSGKKKAAALAGEILPCSRPDLDNYIKAIADGCNGITYRDDSQVVWLMARKCYGQTPGCIVTIEPIAEELRSGRAA
jgi:Holliday junction resolvase RusA-like endonuclease